MGLRIRTNIASLNAQRTLIMTTNEMQSSMQKLAAGKRINKAADDAAGLAVSENLRTQIVSLTQAKRNAADGISIIQTAEGGLNETSNILTRLRELAIQSASDTITDNERTYIQLEHDSLKSEIDRLANTVEFNGTKLLIGDGKNVPDGLEMKNHNVFPLSIQVSKDYYPEADNNDAPNPVNVIRLNMERITGYAAGLGLGNAGDSDEIKVSTKTSAQNSITRVDDALGQINSSRAYLGATQNRISSAINNLNVQIENLQSSRSTIVDTDFASETANLTQQSIIQKAGVSVLSQANASPNVVLNLLG